MRSWARARRPSSGIARLWIVGHHPGGGSLRGRRFAQYLRGVPEDVVRGIASMRNIASHLRYRSMNDDVVWTTQTSHLAQDLAAWPAAAPP